MVMGGIQLMPPPGADSLTDEEVRVVMEWIDLGALWTGLPEEGVPVGAMRAGVAPGTETGSSGRGEK
jgi:hypothetical protein